VFAVVVAGLWGLPIALYPDLSQHDLSALSAKDRLDEIDKRLNLQSSSRAVLAQALGGLILLWGAYAAWTQFRQDDSDRRLQRQHDRELLLSEQFKSAVGFLASPANDIRVAAVFSIGQIAESSESYRPAVGELLSALVRTRSGWPPEPPRAAADASLDELLELRIHAPDVQAAMQVLGRHTFRWYGSEPFRFRYADLRRANLSGLHLEKAAFTEAHLERAWMPGTKLRYASFRGGDLTEANLDSADLRETNLRGTALTAASLEGTDLQGARFDETTLWPAGYTESHAIHRGAIKVPHDSPPTSVPPIDVVAE
jgi:hypothetical protein